MTSRVTVREATIRLLRSFGLTTVFGNPGSTELPFFKQWPDDFRYVLALQEASAVSMADGFAQATRNAAVVSLHTAAGLGHALGSVFTASRNHTPLVITAGQQARAMLATEPYLYAQSPAEFPKPYVKWSEQPARAEDVPAAIARAYYVARQPPAGPTFVSIPLDDWDVETDAVEPREVSFSIAPDPAALKAVADALNRSERPALVVGPAVDRDDAWAATVELAERTGAAVWVSPMSARASFPEDHPLFAGFLPGSRKPLADQLSRYDVVVVLGAPIFTYHVRTGGPVVAKGTQLFQITDDPSAAGAAAAGTSILGSLRLAITQLVALLGRPHLGHLSRVPLPRGEGTAWVPRQPGTALTSFSPLERPAPRPPTPEPTVPLSAEFVLDTLARLMPLDAVVVEEVPSHRPAVHDYLPIRTSGGFYAGASGGLGFALPAAVGVALANPARRVICLVGDGSIMYSIQALWTASQHRLPVTFLILNNGGYGALKSFAQILQTGATLDFNLPGLDLVVIARGHGCLAERIEQPSELVDALTRALAAECPTVLDVVVDPKVPTLY